MRHVFIKGFIENLEALPRTVQKKFWKQLAFLLKDLQHPSLHAKRYDETKGVWQARVDRNYRFYFLIETNMYVLLDIRMHPK